MSKKCENKVVLYVKSVNVSTRFFADQQGGGKHPCDRGVSFLRYDNPSVNLEGTGGCLGNFYSEKNWSAINIANIVQEKTGINIELIDLGKGFWNHMKLAFKIRGKTPKFMINDELLPDISNVEELMSYLE